MQSRESSHSPFAIVTSEYKTCKTPDKIISQEFLQLEQKEGIFLPGVQVIVELLVAALFLSYKCKHIKKSK